jgi:hypothetical protein
MPVELTRLSMAEKFLIQRCYNYVPSVHLSNGTFALKGHCVTFLQDISAICNELPLLKETTVVFVWYIGNKDTSAVYPVFTCQQKNVIEALLWLEKHNSVYVDFSIREDNLEWMQGEDEASIASNAEKFKTKNSKQFQIIASETEHVSAAQVLNLDNQAQDSSDCAVIDISTMHANQPDPLLGGNSANIIHSFKDIAKMTGQVSQIMNFPPIEHASPIWYVSAQLS